MQQKGVRFRVTSGKSCDGWLEEVNYGSSSRLIRHMRRGKERGKGKLQNKTRLPTYPSDSMQPPAAATRTRVKTQCRIAIASKEKERYKVRVVLCRVERDWKEPKYFCSVLFWMGWSCNPMDGYRVLSSKKGSVFAYGHEKENTSKDKISMLSYCNTQTVNFVFA